jgi:hypothetical protein
VEDFHKALKTGLGVERLPLKSAARLLPAAALMSVVALRLVGLREQVRRQPQRPADEAGLNKLTVAVLRSTAHNPIQTVADVALAIGRLGVDTSIGATMAYPAGKRCGAVCKNLSCSSKAFACRVSYPDLGKDKGSAGGLSWV